MFGSTLSLGPTAASGTVALARAGSWRVDAGDTDAALELSGKLAPGCYVLTIGNLAADGPMEDPHLLLDTGCGFEMADRIDVDHDPATGAGRAVFATVRPAAGLRFVPSLERGTLTCADVTLRHQPLWQWRLGRVWSAGGKALRSRGNVVRAARLLARALRSGGLSGLRGALGAAVRTVEESAHRGTTYARWVALYDTLSPAALADLAAEGASMGDGPVISVLMPVYDPPAELLAAAVESVRAQLYPRWRLCIANDASTAAHVAPMLDRYAAQDSRVVVVHRQSNGHISNASNSALELVTGDWVALLDHDDVLRPHALLEVAREIARHPDAQLVYSDEDKIDAEGNRFDPYFKPDFSPELIRSQNYFNHLTVHRADQIRAVGGWRLGFEGSQDYDLNLRIVERIEPRQIRHIPKVLYHWRAVAGSTAVAGSEKSYAYTAGLRALSEHLARADVPATAEDAPGVPFYRVKPRPEGENPLVSLIIPTRDKVEVLRHGLESIYAKTAYPNYEVIVVDNGSVEQATLDYFATIAQRADTRVLRYDKPFNYSAINNFGVAHARGAIVGLVNNDVEIIAPDWLNEMAGWAMLPGVGCVGAKLYFGNGLIQHAGVVLGIGGVAGHSHKYFPRDHNGYFGRLKIVQNVSAVTGACLLVRRELYEQVGGLEEEGLSVAFNDIDFCLRVAALGYRNVFTPYAELFHLESISRGAEDSPQKRARFNRELGFMKRRWGAALRADPFYSPNLTLRREDFSLSFPPRNG
jgi:GT2 family glycosyltransferase